MTGYEGLKTGTNGATNKSKSAMGIDNHDLINSEGDSSFCHTIICIYFSVGHVLKCFQVLFKHGSKFSNKWNEKSSNYV